MISFSLVDCFKAMPSVSLEDVATYMLRCLMCLLMGIQTWEAFSPSAFIKVVA